MSWFFGAITRYIGRSRLFSDFDLHVCGEVNGFMVSIVNK